MIAQTFVKIHQSEEAQMMDLNPFLWYPVIEISGDRIKVADFRGGFSSSEFPKKWVKQIKEEIREEDIS